tara:strand:- start:722 stop:877 length:156 start_codon:yes stop_codon:yes gene_type:complete
MDIEELVDHYTWYIEYALYNNEIPLSFEEYRREIEPNLLDILNGGGKDESL